MAQVGDEDVGEQGDHQNAGGACGRDPAQRLGLACRLRARQLELVLQDRIARDFLLRQRALLDGRL